MKCPTDGATLVMSDRSGVEIDYCPECRGVWLDRGELDKILERSVSAPAPAPVIAPAPVPAPVVIPAPAPASWPADWAILDPYRAFASPSPAWALGRAPLRSI